MRRTLEQLMAEANAVIDTVAVHDAIECLGSPDTVLIDLRHETERAEHGVIPGAVHAPRGYLEFLADPASAMHKPIFASGKRLVLFCASGGRSTLAAKTLVDMGVAGVAHMPGGYAAWREAGGPTRSV